MAPGDHPLLGWETPRSLAIGLHRATRRARGGDLEDDGQWQADRHLLGGSAQQLGEKQRRREVLERVGNAERRTDELDPIGPSDGGGRLRIH